jgi:hypothetical protein
MFLNSEPLIEIAHKEKLSFFLAFVSYLDSLGRTVLGECMELRNM